MRTIPASIQTELDSGSPRISRYLKMIFTNGDVHAFTNHDKDLLIGGVLHKPAAGLSSVKYTATSDAQVSSQQIEASVVEIPDSALRSGLADNATIEAGWVSWVDPAGGKLVVFTGTIGQVQWSDVGFKTEVVSFMKELEKNLGHTYTASCRHKLYGTVGAGDLGACLVNPAAFTFSGTVNTVVLPKWKFTISGAAIGKGDGYFSNGVLTFTSGSNAGLSTTVKKHASETFELYISSAFPITSGTTFSVKAGCDKSLETCKNKFSNVVNFGGFPHINSEINLR